MAPLPGTTFRGNADVPGPAAGTVVQPGNHHFRQDVGNIVAIDDLLPS